MAKADTPPLRGGSARSRTERAATGAAQSTGKATVALRIAQEMGLLTGPKSKHFNAKVSPLLFQAAAKRIGSTSPAVVVSAALAALATEDELGKWLASRWGVLANSDRKLLDQIDI